MTEELPPSSDTLRVEKIPNVINNKNDARSVIQEYNATILIWGWYDDGSGQANVELETGKITSAKTDFIPATPDSFHFNNIAARTSYIVFFSLGMMQLDSSMTSALDFFNAAIESADGVGDVADPWEALMWRGNIYSWGNEYESAISDYTEAIRLHPHKEGFFNRGASYSNLE